MKLDFNRKCLSCSLVGLDLFTGEGRVVSCLKSMNILVSASSRFYTRTKYVLVR